MIQGNTKSTYSTFEQLGSFFRATFVLQIPYQSIGSWPHPCTVSVLLHIPLLVINKGSLSPTIANFFCKISTPSAPLQLNA